MDLITKLATIRIETDYLSDGGSDTDLMDSVGAIIKWIVGILGLIAVVMIIMGGISYMTSMGDASKVKKGKDTILYGIIGLVICALAYAIVSFVVQGLAEV